MSVVAYLTAAVICFSGQCHPMLSGAGTPTGTFPLVRAKITKPGYGGDVLVFSVRRRKDGKLEYPSVHRIWLENKGERRLEKMAGPAEGRRFVSNDCINVMPNVYDSIVQSGFKTIEIRK